MRSNPVASERNVAVAGRAGEGEGAATAATPARGTGGSSTSLREHVFIYTVVRDGAAR